LSSANWGKSYAVTGTFGTADEPIALGKLAAMADQCDSRWSGTRCQLVSGHDSTHASRAGRSLISWANQLATDPTRVELHWASCLPDDE
jgi:hypothetical protein